MKTSHDEAQAREAATEVLHLEKTLGFAPGVEVYTLRVVLSRSLTLYTIK